MFDSLSDLRTLLYSLFFITCLFLLVFSVEPRRESCVGVPVGTTLFHVH
ncbi:hypothetical protein FGIG_07334 [Fasciola gigantica]|uniref:Uncharacterized protein n=1 Tax=Fasciola gigantica TaxID=46835 RepID=A0A504YLR3_FASGI|nr:hypothetical protein FGIG_07334 [Fasciola gigantica]